MNSEKSLKNIQKYIPCSLFCILSIIKMSLPSMKPTSFIACVFVWGAGVGISVNWVILKFIEKNRYQSHNNMDGRNILYLTGVA